MVINPTILLTLYRKNCEEPIGKLELVNWIICTVLWILWSFKMRKGLSVLFLMISCNRWYSGDSAPWLAFTSTIENQVSSSSGRIKYDIIFIQWKLCNCLSSIHVCFCKDRNASQCTYKISEPVILQGKMLKWNLKSHLLAWTSGYNLSMSSGSHRTIGIWMPRGLRLICLLDLLEAENSLKVGYHRVTGGVRSNFIGRCCQKGAAEFQNDVTIKTEKCVQLCLTSTLFFFFSK